MEARVHYGNNSHRTQEVGEDVLFVGVMLTYNIQIYGASSAQEDLSTSRRHHLQLRCCGLTDISIDESQRINGLRQYWETYRCWAEAKVG